MLYKGGKLYLPFPMFYPFVPQPYPLKIARHLPGARSQISGPGRHPLPNEQCHARR